LLIWPFALGISTSKVSTSLQFPVIFCTRPRRQQARPARDFSFGQKGQIVQMQATKISASRWAQALVQPRVLGRARELTHAYTHACAQGAECVTSNTFARTRACTREGMSSDTFANMSTHQGVKHGTRTRTLRPQHLLDKAAANVNASSPCAIGQRGGLLIA
jgi:hypothetical protein